MSVIMSILPVYSEVLSVPHRFLLDSGDSGGIQCIPEEWKLAGGSANSVIPVVSCSGRILAFRSSYQNVPRNSPERNATGMIFPEWYLIVNSINKLINNLRRWLLIITMFGNGWLPNIVPSHSFHTTTIPQPNHHRRHHHSVIDHPIRHRRQHHIINNPTATATTVPPPSFPRECLSMGQAEPSLMSTTLFVIECHWWWHLCAMSSMTMTPTAMSPSMMNPLRATSLHLKLARMPYHGQRRPPTTTSFKSSVYATPQTTTTGRGGVGGRTRGSRRRSRRGRGNEWSGDGWMSERRLRRWRGSKRTRRRRATTQRAARWREPNTLPHSSSFIPPNNGGRLLSHGLDNGAACFPHAALFSRLSFPWCWRGGVQPTRRLVTTLFPKTKRGGIDP